PQDFAHVYERFQAPISKKYDCGRKCAPINEGIPVCCDHDRAVPVADKGEWDLLRKRTDLWKVYTPKNKTEEKEFGDMASGCQAILCKGVKYCERENRTLACRSFPFFPYFNTEKELVGLSYYWGFEKLCWVISNLTIVEKQFVDEMIYASEYLFKKDQDELDTYITYSATMRGVFTKRGRPIPVIGRDGKYYLVKPGSGGALTLVPKAEFEKNLSTFNGDK
ncbi:MAG: hypothetical protein JNK21_13205, partial [Rhodospirillaceae bacterium]|nr:hypothetical protein [Rhodospirillaceae bacterium]